MKQIRGHAWVGTSNPVIPGNKNTFPEAFRSTSRLHYYGTLFSSVEINKSFYKVPLLKTYERWSQEVPDNFRFSVKLSKEITHAKELKDNLHRIEPFLKAGAGIAAKAGCILVQFPGKVTLEYFKQVELILQELKNQSYGIAWNIAVEFRNPGWYVSETWEMLNEHNVAMVLHDMPKAKMMETKGHAGFVYLRFHGPAGDYRDEYTDQYLQQSAAKLNRWLKEGKDVYAYFNNTIGSAFENARYLQSLLK